ncbi:MAG: two-component system response regulator [Porticoccaceae bacterium]|nr:MAG: two-component system response regulator [Porticoccaceae bacterium]
MSADRALTAPLRVLVVDDDPVRAGLLEERLADAGYAVVAAIPSAAGLLAHIERERPDVVLIDLASPERDVLESLAVVDRHNPRPVVMFAERDDPSWIEQALRAGVCTYMVGRIDPERVRPIIDLALAQFRALRGLRQELSDTRAELETRKLVERAKGLVMARHGLSEAEAHRLLTRLAMDRNQRLAEVARAVVDALAPPERGGKGP